MPSLQTPGSWQTYKRLLSYLRPYWPVLVLGVLANAFFSFVDASLAKSLEPFVDKGFVAKDEDFLGNVPYWVLLFVLLRTSSGFVSEYAMGLVGRGVVQDLRQQIFDKYLRLPAAYFDQHSPGEMVSAITYNTERVSHSVAESLKDFVRETAMVVFCTYIVIEISWKLGALFFIGGPLIAWVLRSASKRFRRISRSLQDSMGVITQVSTEAVQGYRTIKTFGGEAQESLAFDRAAEQSRRQQMKMIVTKSLSVGLVHMIAGLALAGVLVMSAGLMVRNELTAGEFVAAVTAMLALTKPLRTLSTLTAQWQQGIAAAQSIFEILDLDTEHDTGTRTLTRASGDLQFDNVQFAFGADKPAVLNGVSLSIPAGKTLAVVGRSGSGKTTLTNLLLRFYRTGGGVIRLDGQPIQDYRLADFRRQFAVVSQHVTLFNDSVRANIAYGDMAGASDEQIIAAAKIAQAWDFISAMPQGLDTPVGENGLALSGGQRQRLAIARAVLKNAPVLILDEATSALDNESERLIQRALEALMRDRTTLVIAHRLSTIERADEIAVLDAGQVLERGTHSELLARGGEYARLHARQFDDNE